jgi:hypothetical protein
MQALILLMFAVYGGFRIMLTHKDAKTMAIALRDSLVNRNILLSHSDCLEIVARQFGLADWNTLSAKLSNEQVRKTVVPREVSLSGVASPPKDATPWVRVRSAVSRIRWCGFAWEGAEVGRDFARAEIRNAESRVTLSFAMNASRFARESSPATLASLWSLMRLETLLLCSEHSFGRSSSASARD